MKLLSFKRIKDKKGEYGIDKDGEEDWFVQLETEKERELYERMNVIVGNYLATAKAYDDWNALLKKELNVEDDDVFYYFMENETPPTVGEEFTIDSLVFRREE